MVTVARGLLLFLFCLILNRRQECPVTCLNVVKGRYITTVRKIRWQNARYLIYVCAIMHPYGVYIQANSEGRLSLRCSTMRSVSKSHVLTYIVCSYTLRKISKVTLHFYASFESKIRLCKLHASINQGFAKTLQVI